MKTPANQATLDKLLQRLCEWNEKYNLSLRRNEGYELRKAMRVRIQVLEQEIIKLKQEGTNRSGTRI